MAAFPYEDRYLVHRTLPEVGTPREQVLDMLEAMAPRRTRPGRAGSARAPCTAATTTTTTS